MNFLTKRNKIMKGLHLCNGTKMIELGKTQELEVLKKSSNGIYLHPIGGSEKDKVLLPNNQVPDNCNIGDKLTVFIYRDSEDRLIATRETPYITLHQLAVLEVVETNSIGAFLNWGLAKDLFLPFKEQTRKVKKGDHVLVSLYTDKSNRLCATMNVYEYLNTNHSYKKDDHVTGIVYETSKNYGVFVAVDNQYSGLIPIKELAAPLIPGDTVHARITGIREDGKLNLSLRDKSYKQIGTDSDFIYHQLLKNNGFMPLHDKSSPEEIKAILNLSKAAFKRAVGHLLKERKIELTENGIRIKK